MHVNTKAPVNDELIDKPSDLDSSELLELEDTEEEIYSLDSSYDGEVAKNHESEDEDPDVQ